jgi:hypothetical protein
MNELPGLCRKKVRFQNTVQAAVEYFRSGYDSSGLDCLLNSMDDLESITDAYQYLGEPWPGIDKIMTPLRQLNACIENQDVVGITDVLEFTVYPLSKEWLKGCDKP